MSLMFHQYQLSLEDPQKFCQSLVRWCSTAKDQRAILLFDAKSLEKVIASCRDKFGLQGIAIEELPRQVKRLSVKYLTIRWMNYGGQQSILKEVIDDSTGNPLYQVPDAFAGSTIWYGD